MADTEMLQTIASSISELRQETKKGFEDVNKRIDKVNDRLDRQGASLAYLEDDAPTIRDFNKLEIARLCV